MTTPAKSRQSAIPGPGRASGIPTPGRPRSASNVNQWAPDVPSDDISRAFADAMKANDPSQHRSISQSTSISSSSLSPQVSSYSVTGRRSVVGRPSSAASSSSSGAPPNNKASERAKTPISTRAFSRPPSRQSEAPIKPTRAFEVGDNVRIESLGFEGILRYVGEISGKPGLWAGVELGGGFAGKGKNNGTVAGKRYFTCPENCGVFVSTTKLSPPTVGPGAIPRPSSVASSRGGRITPALSGRITPSCGLTSRTPSASYSASNGNRSTSTSGRITPSVSSGRVTPSLPLSSAPRTLKTPVAKSLSEKISTGSRASKYMSMTAQQLQSHKRDTTPSSPTRQLADGAIFSSPSLTRALSSPTKSTSSPFSTPKAGLGKLSLTGAGPGSPTGKGRSSMNTPRARIPSGIAMPPPASPRRLTHRNGGEAFPDPGTRSSVPTPGSAFGSPRPESAMSLRSDEVSAIEQLQSRLEAAEYENERLRSLTSKQSTEVSLELQSLRQEKEEMQGQVRVLEAKLLESEEVLATQILEKGSLEDEKNQLASTLSEFQVSEERRVSALQLQLDTAMEQLRAAKEENDKRIAEVEAILADRTEDHARAVAEAKQLHLERDDLLSRVNELRIAGQETIALYEEQLSAATNERHDLELRISSLESSLRTMAANERSNPAAPVSSATEIENESLREQVQHLQSRAEKVEEKLQEARMASEREIMEYREAMKTLRLEEEQMKRELALKTREVDKLTKSESGARSRADEIREALRESTVALENTRGELECLRLELTNLDLLIDDEGDGDVAVRVASVIKRLSSERTSLEQEVLDLKKEVDRSGDYKEQISRLYQDLDIKAAELEDLRKKVTRDVSSTNSIHEAKGNSPKSDAALVKEEVAGLKHIIQELQKENAAATQRIKILESENQLLNSEMEHLRQEVQVLEDNLDSGPQEHVPDNINQDSDVETLQHRLRDLVPRYEAEIEQLRKRANEAEMKHTREVHDLNKEIGELEALVESKIYREDELEQEVEKLKDKLARHRKGSKASSSDAPDPRHRLSSASSTFSSTSVENPAGQDLCEICERPGHDIFSCSMLKEETTTVTVAGQPDGDLFCEDCETPGHVAKNCPHAMDVF